MTQQNGNRKIIDLSVPLQNYARELVSPQIVYRDHHEGALHASKAFGVEIEDFQDCMAMAGEVVTANTHAGTHMDAPWHYGPTTGGRPAMRIDEVPLEWCFADGVVLDLRHKQAGDEITVGDIDAALAKISYALKPLDIVLIDTGAGDLFERSDYINLNAGMTAEATHFLLERGVKVIGIDAWGFDVPPVYQAERYRKGEQEKLFPAHFIGRELEICIVEKLCNLGSLPAPFGFQVAVFPIKVAKGSGAWCRAVAIFDASE